MAPLDLLPGAALLLLAAFLAACTEDPVRYGPGILAPRPPAQKAAEGDPRLVEGFSLTPRATFEVTARVLAKRRYRWDELAPVAPWDFALGWGVLSDEDLIAGTKVLQGDRLMYWHLYALPLPLPLVERSSANMHLIPATPAIAERLAAIPRGALTTLTGTLVDLTLPDGRTIPTSLSRLDRGVGACEILYVTAATWAPPDDRALRPSPQTRP